MEQNKFKYLSGSKLKSQLRELYFKLRTFTPHLKYLEVYSFRVDVSPKLFIAIWTTNGFYLSDFGSSLNASRYCLFVKWISSTRVHSLKSILTHQNCSQFQLNQRRGESASRKALSSVGFALISYTLLWIPVKSWPF